MRGTGDSLNVAQARALAARLRSIDPTLRVEQWHLAQGLCRLRIEQRLHPGHLYAVVSSAAEAAALLGIPLADLIP